MLGSCTAYVIYSSLARFATNRTTIGQDLCLSAHAAWNDQGQFVLLSIDSRQSKARNHDMNPSTPCTVQYNYSQVYAQSQDQQAQAHVLNVMHHKLALLL
jgi:hypothetical protein